ncbi:MAG TPA: glycosyltransferase family 87 protein [Vicinamibacterales bacterium]
MISDEALLTVLRKPRRVALTGDLIRGGIGLAMACTLFFTLAYYGAVGQLMYNHLHMNDFGKFYYSAQLFLNGQDMYGPSPATGIPVGKNEIRQFLNMNPPHFHLLILPLALLSPLWAISIWLLVSVVALVAAARAIARALDWHWTPARVAWVVFAVVVCSATAANVITGQLTFVMMLPITLAWIAARRGDWSKASVLLGIAASIKPFLGVFWVYLLVTREWRPLLLMTVAGALCVLAGVIVFGPGAYESWRGALSAVEWWWPPMNGSVTGFLGRSLSVNPIYVPAMDAPGLIRPAALLLSAAAVVGLVLSLARNRSVDLTFAGLLLTAQLISPLGWVYYLWFAAGPLVALWWSNHQRVKPSGKLFLALALPGLVCPLTYVVMWKGALATVTLGSIYWWSTLFLWAAVLVGFEKPATVSTRPAR